MHEINRDGNCSLLVIQDGRVRAFTRNGFDWTDRYSRVVDCAARLPCWSAVLDGEIIVQDERGLSDFGALRRAMAREIFGEADPLCPIQFCEAVEGDGATGVRRCRPDGLEGIVSKRAPSRYRSGPCTAWLKTKCMTEGEFIVVGMAPGNGGPPFALLRGRRRAHWCTPGAHL